MIRRHSSNVMSSQAVNGTIAATLTSTSTLPWRLTVSSTMRCTSASLRHVDREPERAGQLRGGLLRARAVDVGEDDLGALVGELLGDRPADPLGGIR